MAFIEPFFSYAETVFEFLALNSLYSAFLACVLLTVKLFFSNLPKPMEYGLWCLVLIRLVLPTDFSVIYSLGYLSNLWLDAQLPAFIKSSDWLAQVATRTLFDSGDTSVTLFRLLLIAWVFVSSLVALKYLRLKIKLSKLLATAHPVEQEWLDRIVNEWRREFEIRRQIIVIDSNDFLSPFTFGILSPVIFIPEQLLREKNIEVLKPIFAHELAHVKRLDALWLVFQNLLQIVYCLNPFLWLAVGRLNSLREEICDQKVLATKNLTNSVYGKSLLRVLRLNIGEKTPEQFATFFLSHKRIFEKRIAAIGNNHPNNTKGFGQTAIMLTMGLFFLPLSWQKVSEIRELRAFIPPPTGLRSPFPENVREEYRPPILFKHKTGKSNKNRTNKVEIERTRAKK